MKNRRPTPAEAAIFGGTPTLPEIAAASVRKRYHLERDFDELVSTAVVAMIEAFPRYKPGKRPMRAWLIDAAFLAILQEERHLRRAGQVEGERLAPDDGLTLGPSAPAGDVESYLAQAVAVRGGGVLCTAYAALPRNAQYVVELHLVKKLTFPEVAKALRCSEKTARNRYGTAVEAIRTMFAERGDVVRPVYLADADGTLFPPGDDALEGAARRSVRRERGTHETL